MKLIATSLIAAALVAGGTETFEKLFREIGPPAGEAWRSIPWETELLDAQAKAAETGKPLFIWAMDGHPLGCT